MALRAVLILMLWLGGWFPLMTGWGAENTDSHTRSGSSHSHAEPPEDKSNKSETKEAAPPVLTEEQQAHLDAAAEECVHNVYTLKANQQKYCFSPDGSFKVCEGPGKFVEPAQGPPDSTAALALLMQYHKCVYCRPGGNVTFSQGKCIEASKDLIQMEQIEKEVDQKSYEDKLKYYLQDIPEGLVTATQLGIKTYEAYKKIKKALEALKDKNEPPPPPPPAEVPVGPDFMLPPELPPPPAGAPQQVFPGGATQTARVDGGNKGGKFLGFGDEKKDKDKSTRKSAAPPPTGATSGEGGSGAGGGSSGGGSDAGSLGSDAQKPGMGPYVLGDKDVAFGGGKGGAGGSGSNALENQLLGELLSEDNNKVKSRLPRGESGKDNGKGGSASSRTGIVLLLERIRYTTEKTMGEIYIPTPQE